MMLNLVLLMCGLCQLIELSKTENNAVCHQLCNKPENMICCQLCNSQPEYARCSSHSGPHCSYWNTSQCPEISFSTHALEEMISKISNNICSNKIHTQTRTSPKSEWENKTEATLPSGEVPALGATVGLLVVALIVTITGWVCTCWILKKRGDSMDANSEQTVTNNTPSVHQLHNPTYDAQLLPVVTHSRAVSVLITNEGESLPITINPEPSIPKLLSNSQHMGVDDENETNIYHILEGPGDDADYEDLDAELDAEEKAHTKDNQGENLYHVLEGPTLETEELEDTTKDVDGE